MLESMIVKLDEIDIEVGKHDSFRMGIMWFNRLDQGTKMEAMN